MEFRNMMWELFVSTGNLDAYLAYRACADLGDSRSEGHNDTINLQKECQLMSVNSNVNSSVTSNITSLQFFKLP